MTIKKGDRVLVMTGKDRGKSGVITKVFPKTDRITVEGVNALKKHTKPNAKYPHGGVLEFFGPIRRDNVQLVCGNCEKRTRIKTQETADGTIRICMHCKQAVDTKKAGKK